MNKLNILLILTIGFAMVHCKENKSAEAATEQVNGDNAIEAVFVEAGLGDLTYYTFKDKAGTEHNFDVNKSSLQFLLESEDADAEQGWKSNEKLVGKNFRLTFKEEKQFDESAGMELTIKTIQSAQLLD